MSRCSPPTSSHVQGREWPRVGQRAGAERSRCSRERLMQERVSAVGVCGKASRATAGGTIRPWTGIPPPTEGEALLALRREGPSALEAASEEPHPQLLISRGHLGSSTCLKSDERSEPGLQPSASVFRTLRMDVHIAALLSTASPPPLGSTHQGGRARTPAPGEQVSSPALVGLPQLFLSPCPNQGPPSLVLLLLFPQGHPLVHIHCSVQSSPQL